MSVQRPPHNVCEFCCLPAYDSPTSRQFICSSTSVLPHVDPNVTPNPNHCGKVTCKHLVNSEKLNMGRWPWAGVASHTSQPFPLICPLPETHSIKHKPSPCQARHSAHNQVLLNFPLLFRSTDQSISQQISFLFLREMLVHQLFSTLSQLE